MGSPMASKTDPSVSLSSALTHTSNAATPAPTRPLLSPAPASLSLAPPQVHAPASECAAISRNAAAPTMAGTRSLTLVLVSLACAGRCMRHRSLASPSQASRETWNVEGPAKEQHQSRAADATENARHSVALRSAQLTMLRLRPRRHCRRCRRASHAPRSPTRLRLRSERLWLCHPVSTRPPRSGG